MTHVGTGVPTGSRARPPFRTRLAPWRVSRLMAHIDENLEPGVSVVKLAHAACLSTSHFSKSFKSTFGCGPHAYVMRRRMELAQALMLSSRASLAEIAFRCGLVDQSHLSRVFRRWTGESPASWRSARLAE